MLDEEIAAARRVAEQRAHLGERLRIDGAALQPAAHLRGGRPSRAISTVTGALI